LLFNVVSAFDGAKLNPVVNGVVCFYIGEKGEHDEIDFIWRHRTLSSVLRARGDHRAD